MSSFGVWFTGLSGSGKTTLAVLLAKELRREYGLEPRHLDGDVLRNAVCKDLGFSAEDRNENITRAMAIASWMVYFGKMVPLCSFITPYEALREKAKIVVPNLLMVHVNCPLEICEERDPKGLYARVRAGEIPNFTGIDAPFEPVECADLVLRSNEEDAYDCVQEIIDRLKDKGWL